MVSPLSCIILTSSCLVSGNFLKQSTLSYDRTGTFYSWDFKSIWKNQSLTGRELRSTLWFCLWHIGAQWKWETTMLSILLDILKADEGSFEWFGKPGSPQTRKRIGSLLETPNFYHYLSAMDNLKSRVPSVAEEMRMRSKRHWAL